MTVAADRLEPLVRGKTAPRDRPESEVAGYRDALAEIHANASHLTLSPRLILDFHRRMYALTTARGAKREMVRNSVGRLPLRFRLGDLQYACPGVSYPTLKRALADLRREKRVRCLGKGRDAEWERIGSWNR